MVLSLNIVDSVVLFLLARTRPSGDGLHVVVMISTLSFVVNRDGSRHRPHSESR